MNNYFQLIPAFSYINNPLLINQIDFYQLYQQFSSQINQQQHLIIELKKENQHLKHHIQNINNSKQPHKSSQSNSNTSKQIQIKHIKTKPQRNFICDYQNCDKTYSSTLALNLHIKTKHNGGTKKERDAYAKLIVMAQLRGEPRPEINFIFSQNYLQKFKQRLLLENDIQKSNNEQVKKKQI